MTMSCRRIGQTYEFIESLERFFVEAERAKTAQHPKAQIELSSGLIGRKDHGPEWYDQELEPSRGTHLRYSAEEAVGKSIKMQIPGELDTRRK
jgi:hypothetical protein